MQLYPDLNVRSMGFALLRVALLSYVLLGVLLYLRQDGMMYFPDQTPFADCAALRAAEQIEMGSTRGYFFQNGTSTKLAVMYHGNAGRACDRAYYQAALTHAGYSWLLVEYTGYAGGNGVKPTTSIVLDDVTRVNLWINKQNFLSVAVIGESIGVIPASYHAHVGSVDRLILVTPFESLGAVALDYYPFYPISLMIRHNKNNSEWARSAKSILVVYGTKDTLIRPIHAKKLFDALPQTDKQLLEINGDHNDVPAFGETQIAIMKFLTDS